MLLQKLNWICNSKDWRITAQAIINFWPKQPGYSKVFFPVNGNIISRRSNKAAFSIEFLFNLEIFLTGLVCLWDETEINDKTGSNLNMLRLEHVPQNGGIWAENFSD